MRFSGKIMQTGCVIQESVKGEYQDHVDSRKVSYWAGTLSVPAGQFVPSGFYQLVLDDGRSGDVNIETHFGAGVASMGFTGASPLT